jgi:hypothetical protein
VPTSIATNITLPTSDTPDTFAGTYPTFYHHHSSVGAGSTFIFGSSAIDAALDRLQGIDAALYRLQGISAAAAAAAAATAARAGAAATARAAAPPLFFGSSAAVADGFVASAATSTPIPTTTNGASSDFLHDAEERLEEWQERQRGFARSGQTAIAALASTATTATAAAAAALPTSPPNDLSAKCKVCWDRPLEAGPD